MTRPPAKQPGNSRRRAAITGLVMLFVAGVMTVLAMMVPSGAAGAQQNGDYKVDAPKLVLTGVLFSVDVEVKGDDPPESLTLEVDGEETTAEVSDGTATFDDVTASSSGQLTLTVLAGGQEVASQTTTSIPGWMSILPPLLTIGIALIFRQVIPALFLGIYAGAILTHGVSFSSLWYGLLDTVQVHVINGLAPPDDQSHIQILVFSFMIGGMVGIVSKNGGMRGVVNLIVRMARTPRRGKVTTGVLGLVVFFDDYTNALVVGNAMRSVTDRLRISREKLAYLVDSTAAPVASIALVTTWIGFEIGLIGDAVGRIDGFDLDPYAIFLNSLPYAFYPILAILLVFVVAFSGRDFGPMYRAERRARLEGKVLRDGADVDSAAAGGEEMACKEEIPQRAVNAIVPILTLVGVALVGLYITGEGDTLTDIVGSADSYAALMWASLLSVLVAAVMTAAQRILTLNEVTKAWYAGVRFMLFGVIILVMAWALANVMDDLQTGDYLVTVLGGNLPPAIVPALIFLLAAVMSFATGTSWGTMGILFPLAIPLTWSVLQANDMADPAHYFILYAAIRSILSGAIFGDHCSPISDTTILSSFGSGCDHVDHVRTQLPYAILIGIVALLFGLLPMGFGVPGWILLIASVVALVVAFWLISKRVDDGGAPTARPGDGGTAPDGSTAAAEEGEPAKA